MRANDIQIFRRTKNPDDCGITVSNSPEGGYPSCHLEFDPELIKSWGDSPDYGSRGAAGATLKGMPIGKRWKIHRQYFALEFIKRFMRIYKLFPQDGQVFYFDDGPDREAIHNPIHRDKFLAEYFRKHKFDARKPPPEPTEEEPAPPKPRTAKRRG